MDSRERLIAMATDRDTDTADPIETRSAERVRRALVNAIAYMIPLVMSSPGLYAGIMTAPFLVYLVLMFTSQEGVPYLLLGGSMLENIVLTLGIAFFLYSVISLWRTKSKGLVTCGPYRIVRHPQYLSLILFTAALTSRSVWVLLNTFGMGFLPPHETIAVWFIMVLVYLGLAVFEEHHLAGVHQEEWSGYRRRVGFLIPLVTSKRRWLEIVVSLIFLVVLMVSLLQINNTLWWFL